MRAMVLTALLFCGCTSTKYVERTSETMSKAIYAAQDAQNVGRFDLSTQYVDAAAKLIPPPKERIKILPVYE